MDKEKILEKLNKEQAEAVLQTEGPLLILAGAGSGKTRVLVHRIAYLIDQAGVRPGNILAITFTNKAADEMRERVNEIVGFGAQEIWVMTFHACCVRILRRHAEDLGFSRYFSIYDTDDQLSLMKEIFRRRNIDPKMMKEKSVLRVISAAKDELVTPEKFRQSNKGDFRLEKMADLYDEYQNRLRDNNAMDFDDLINMTVRLFREKPDVLALYQERFRYLMVDEYQDTNTAQFEFVRLLSAKYGNLCVVGDDDQSIYKFRGANIGNILGFEKQFPQAKTIKLEQNYRSTQRILDAANEVIQNNEGRKKKHLWTGNGEGDKVRLRRFANGFEEAEFIVGEIAQKVRDHDCDYKDCAILYRTNAQSRLFEEKFLMANIPYQIVGGTNFYSRREIKDLLAYLKTVDNAVDGVAVKRIINIPKRGIGAASIEKVDAYAEEAGISFFDAACEASEVGGLGRTADKIRSFTDFIGSLRTEAKGSRVGELLKRIVEQTGYVQELKEEDTEESQARIENIDELISKAVTYDENTEQPSLSGFLEEVALIADIDTVEDTDNKVLLMTLHSAKGLEFDNVYMAGMEEGLFPSYLSMNAEDGSEIEEERRLCYVGITRARKNLTLTCAHERMLRGDVQNMPMSQFVEEIPREMIDMGYEKAKPAEIEPPKAGPYAKMREAFRAKAYAPPRSIGAGGKEKPAYAVGDTVSHARFGEGVVKEINEGGRDYEVTVDFDGTVRKMFASFANLKKI